MPGRTVLLVKVLAYVHGYPPVHAAGGEMMLHGWLKDLLGRGHEVCVLATAAMLAAPGVFDGVPVVCASNLVDVRREWQAADVVVTHLNMTCQAVRFGREFGKPVVHLVHNDKQLAAAGVFRGQLAVFNSQWVRAATEFVGRQEVMFPPIAAEHYEPFPVPGDRVTLMNLNEAKGGRLFWEVAAAMPRHKFLAVKGAYGQQVVPDVVPPNVDVIENAPGVRDRVLARTRVLIQPSEYESWGMASGEAAASGVPVVVCPTAGLREQHGDAAVYAEFGDVDGWVAALTALDDPVVYAARSAAVFERAAGNRDATSRQADAVHDALCEAVAAFDPAAERLVFDDAQDALLREGVWVRVGRDLLLMPHKHFIQHYKGRSGVRAL